MLYKAETYINIVIKYFANIKAAENQHSKIAIDILAVNCIIYIKLILRLKKKNFIDTKSISTGGKYVRH